MSAHPTRAPAEFADPATDLTDRAAAPEPTREPLRGRNEDTEAILQRLLSKQKIIPDAPREQCADLKPGEFCDNNIAHYIGTERQRAFTRWCPAAERERIRSRVAEERKRLAGPLAAANEGTRGEGFDGWDPQRYPLAERAADALRRFSLARPPSRGVVLVGPVGLGKTRLLLASHLALVEAGIDSRFITARQLRHLFTAAESFEDEEAREARQHLQVLRQCSVLHLDDLGDADRDQRRIGLFRSELKGLFDEGRFVHAVSLNLSLQDAREHPEVGEKMLSRLSSKNALVLHLQGRDQRQHRQDRGR